MATDHVTKIFLTGATGYIGGSILSRLITHPNHASFAISIIVRKAEKAKDFKEQFGIRTIVGSNSDTQLLEEEASNADIIIHTANSSDDFVAASAILAGAKRHHLATGKAPMYIHTSGTGVLADTAEGDNAGGIVYNDLDVEQLKSIPPSAVHRNVDLAVLRADTEGYVRTYIVVPSTIYGLATGPLFDAGLANAHSIMIPSLIQASIDRRQAGVVGKGANIWPNVHILDTAELYIVLLNEILGNLDAVGHGWAGFYFGENGEHRFIDVGKEIGKAMVEFGVAQTEEVTPFSDEELQKYYSGSKYMGTNARATAERARKIGWKPTKTTADLLRSVRAETEAILKPIDGNFIDFAGKIRKALAKAT